MRRSVGLAASLRRVLETVGTPSPTQRKRWGTDVHGSSLARTLLTTVDNGLLPADRTIPSVDLAVLRPAVTPAIIPVIETTCRVFAAVGQVPQQDAATTRLLGSIPSILWADLT